jgi:hypothetical protein
MLATASRHRIRRTIGGVELPRSCDGRTVAAKRFRYLVEEYARDLGGVLSEAERSLIRQAAGLQMEAERLQEAIARGEVVDPDQMIRISGTSKRLLQIIASRTGKREAPASASIDDLFAVEAEAGAE